MTAYAFSIDQGITVWAVFLFDHDRAVKGKTCSASGIALRELRCHGGASVNGFQMQFQADNLAWLRLAPGYAVTRIRDCLGCLGSPYRYLDRLAAGEGSL